MPLALFDLDNTLDGCVVSAIAGVRKPDRRIFETAAELVGEPLPSHGAWLVGDSPTADIGGAHLAGLHSIWLTRGRRWSLQHYAPDLTVGRIEEALERLETHDTESPMNAEEPDSTP
jgi:putative hydrolase of the HAD superfamily